MKTKPMSQEQAEKFVSLWQTAPTGAAVARAMNLSRQRVHQIARQFRLVGIPLKSRNYQLSYKDFDLAKLRRIALEKE